MIKGVVFDLDGTLLNTLTNIAYCVNTNLEIRGYSTHTLEEYRRFIGNGADSLVRKSLPHGLSECDIEQFKKTFLKFYAENSNHLVSVYEGIYELINQLKDNNIKIAVVSNKPDDAVKTAVDSFFAEGTFDEFGGNREGVPHKPDPTVTIETINRMNIKPCECVFIGDSDVDMITAKNAGTHSIGVLWGFRDLDELIAGGAEYTVNSAQEIFNIISQMNNAEDVI